MPQHHRVPSSQSTTRRLLGAVVATFLSVITTVPTVAASGDDPIGDGAWRVAAPVPGYGIAVTALTVDGRRLGLAVETDRDGLTRIVALGGSHLAASARVGVAASPDACADGRHAELGFRWTGPWQWWFDAASTPTGLGRNRAETQLRSAVHSITASRNDCSRLDRVSARARYMGRTAQKPGVRVTARGKVLCPRDGMNVVGFGALPPGIAGMTCTTYTDPARGRKRAVESDVLFNKRHVNWAIRPRSCSGDQVILRAAATHEFGHVFGLGHVAEATHGNLTMSESIAPCDGSAFTLGKGDIIGLERLY